MPDTLTYGERLLAHGAEALSEGELISMLLGSEAASLLSGVGGLAFLLHADHTALRDLGLQDAEIPLALAYLELHRRLCRQALEPWPNHPERMAAYITATHSLPDQEVMGAVFLDRQGRFLGGKRFFVGSRDGLFAEPRPFLREALRYPTIFGAILFHTHPGGAPQPTDVDLEFTLRVARSSMAIGVELIDHIIVGDGKFVLLREHGYLTDWPAPKVEV